MTFGQKYNVVQKHCQPLVCTRWHTPRLKRKSFIYVTQIPTRSVHNIVNRSIREYPISWNRRIQLRDWYWFSLHLTLKDSLPPTFKNGGAPVGNDRYKAADFSTCSAPPRNDQKLTGCLCCQSYQSLSIIYFRTTLEDLHYSKAEGTYGMVHEEQRI